LDRRRSRACGRSHSGLARDELVTVIVFHVPEASDGGLRVIVADGHELFRIGMREALRGGQEVVLAGEASSWGELLGRDWLGVDVVLVDLDLPGGELIAGLETLKSQAPSLGVIVLATGSETGLLKVALSAGAAGWISKDVGAEALGRAVQQIHEFRNAEIVFSPGGEVATPEGVALTKRQVEILRLVADGSTNAEVARHLWLTERTIKFHLSNIYEKLGVPNRTAACRWAETNKLLPPFGGQIRSAA
jgi:DNA-binding NarL/FixJ family response regulator